MLAPTAPRWRDSLAARRLGYQGEQGRATRGAGRAAEYLCTELNFQIKEVRDAECAYLYSRIRLLPRSRTVKFRSSPYQSNRTSEEGMQSDCGRNRKDAIMVQSQLFEQMIGLQAGSVRSPITATWRTSARPLSCCVPVTASINR